VYRNIVVGTDGSPTAADAVRHAAALARLSGATLHVVNAYASMQVASALAMAGSGMSGVTIDSEGIEVEMRAKAEEVLDHALPASLCEGVAVQRHSRPGAPADVLVAVAEEQAADLIVVGSRGMTGTRRFLLGSVPNRVAHNAPCNVLIAHTC
jgi:nucleotide-binding universal stress UspA family protein